MQNFLALGAPPQTLVPPAAAAGGLAPKPPLASGGWGLSPQTPKTAPPIANFWLRAWTYLPLYEGGELGRACQRRLQ